MVDLSERMQSILDKNRDMRNILDNYVATIDANIADTDAAVNAVLSARAAVNADATVNANIKAELRAVETALVAFKTECRTYRTAFVWLRDNYSQVV